MITFKHHGSFQSTERFLNASKNRNYKFTIEKYAREGVQALASNTPKDSGLTSEKWGYEIVTSGSGFRIFWTNTNIVDGLPVVILLQYGHGTRSGSFVEGRDFINPAIRPIFDRIAENLWKEVTSI